MNPTKFKKLTYLMEKAEEAKGDILKARTAEYMKPLSSKVWAGEATKSIITFTKVMEKFFNKHKKKLLKIITGDIYKQKPVEVSEKAKYRADDYLDKQYNQVVVKDVRDALKGFYNDMEVELASIYDDELQPVEMAVAGIIMEEMALPFNFNTFDPLVRDYLKTKKIHWAKEVKESTEKRIKSVLVRGYEEGDSIADIAKEIKSHTYFSFFRAEKVARTEILASCSHAEELAWAENDDIIGSKWNSFQDGRERIAHRLANGQYQPKGKPFLVGGEKLMYPRDGSLGASASNIINCRCFKTPVFAGEEKKGAKK